jgi:hypothetical protein
MAVDEPTRGLMELGFGRGNAETLASLLRGRVASLVLDELRGVEYSAAAGVLIGARPGLVHFVPRATLSVLDLGDRSVDPVASLASFCPIAYLDPVVYELLNRARANPARDSRFGVILKRRPEPSKTLQGARSMYAAKVPAGNYGGPPIPASTSDLVADQLRSAIEGISDRSSHAMAKEWTGWALLAALHGLDTYDVRTPVPPKHKASPISPAYPPKVYRTACSLLMGGALSLIAEAEG